MTPMIPSDPARFAQLFSQLYQPVTQQPAITPQSGPQPPQHLDSFEQGAASGTNESSHRRPSRHPQYQDVLTSVQTDDELESTDAKLKTAARQRIYYRRSAQKQGISPAEYSRKLRKAAAERQGLSPTAYSRKLHEAAAERHGLSVTEYSRKLREAAAERHGLSVTEYRRKLHKTREIRQGLSMTEYYRKQREATMARHRLCNQPNDAQTKKRKHDGEELQIPNDFWDIHLDELDFEALLEENGSASPTLSDLLEGSTSRVLPDDLDCIDSLFPANFLPERFP